MTEAEDASPPQDNTAAVAGTTTYGTRVLLISSTAAFAIGLAVALRRTRKERLNTAVTFFEQSRSLPRRPGSVVRAPGAEARSAGRVDELGAVADDAFSPVLDGVKALGVATILCGLLASGAVLTTSYVMDVHDIPSFSHRMRAVIGRALPALRSRLSSQAHATDTDGDREWQALWDEGRQIDAERAEHKRIKKLKSKGTTEQDAPPREPA